MTVLSGVVDTIIQCFHVTRYKGYLLVSSILDTFGVVLNLYFIHRVTVTQECTLSKCALALGVSSYSTQSADV